MDVQRWQGRLSTAFTVNGIIGGEYLPSVIQLESETGNWFVSRFKGHRVLRDCFLDFYANTLAAAVEGLRKHGWPSGLDWYGPILNTHRTMFMAQRATDCLALSGHFYDAYGLFRNQWEQAIKFAAIHAGFSSRKKAEGLSAYQLNATLAPADHDIIYRARIAEEKRIESWAIGSASGLSDANQKELARWSRMFNSQVHGSRFSAVSEGSRWLTTPDQNFALGPLPDETGAAMFMNRSDEVSWATLRSLPFLQPPGRSFGIDWDTKWNVLDISFRESIDSLGRLGKPIAAAFTDFIDAKLPFAPANTYSE